MFELLFVVSFPLSSCSMQKAKNTWIGEVAKGFLRAWTSNEMNCRNLPAGILDSSCSGCIWCLEDTTVTNESTCQQPILCGSFATTMALRPKSKSSRSTAAQHPKNEATNWYIFFYIFFTWILDTHHSHHGCSGSANNSSNFLSFSSRWHSYDRFYMIVHSES